MPIFRKDQSRNRCARALLKLVDEQCGKDCSTMFCVQDRISMGHIKHAKGRTMRRNTIWMFQENPTVHPGISKLEVQNPRRLAVFKWC